MSELKRLDFTKDGFETKNHKYKFVHALSFERFTQMEKCQAELMFGMDYKKIFDEVKRAFEFLNGNNIKPADCAIVLHNIMTGIAKNIDNKTHPALMLCSLFIKREDEDLSVFDEILAKEKIEDWSKDGYAIQDFFQLATNLATDFIPVYKEVSESFLSKEVAAKKKNN